MARQLRSGMRKEPEMNQEEQTKREGRCENGGREEEEEEEEENKSEVAIMERKKETKSRMDNGLVVGEKKHD